MNKLLYSMKLMILGHSYVRDLSKLYILSFDLEQNVQIKYWYWSIASYEKFLENPSLLSDAISYNPDFVLVILGGNSITKDVGSHELFIRCRKFYQLLRDSLKYSIIISAQVELRRYTGNDHETPQYRIFIQKRNGINQFLKRLKSKDHMLIIAGPGRLDSTKYYKADGVHLSKLGQENYMNILKSTIDYILSKRRQISTTP